MLDANDRKEMLEKLQRRLDELKRVNEQLVVSALRNIELVEQLRLQKARYAAEHDRLRGIVESMPDEIWYCDVDAMVTPANPAARASLKAERSGALAEREPMPMAEWLSRLAVQAPDGRRLLPEETAMVRALKGDRITGMQEIWRNPRSGRAVRRNISSAPVTDRQGKIVGAVAVARPVGEKE